MSPATAPGLPPDSIGATLTRDGGRIAHALGLRFAEGYREAQGLLAQVLDVSRAQVTARHREPISGSRCAAYQTLVQRRAGGEPFAYIVGHREFYGLDFVVTPAVLIPRPETELLVEAALERIPAAAAAQILDLGSGSGAIAITLAKHRLFAAVVGVDASLEALGVATGNAARLAVGSVRFEQSDWYAGIPDTRFDLIVSNPPYVAAGDPHLEQGDLRFEPRTALVGGPDGLECIRTIVAGARPHLSAGGWLLFEHGHDQGLACRTLLTETGFACVTSLCDLAGIERVTGGRISGCGRNIPANTDSA